MKWTTLTGSGIVTLIMVSQMAWAEDGPVLTRSMEQSQQRWSSAGRTSTMRARVCGIAMRNARVTATAKAIASRAVMKSRPGAVHLVAAAVAGGNVVISNGRIAFRG